MFFLVDGVLDFALFDGEKSQTLNLQRSGVHLQPGQVKDPLVVFANYILDSLVQDAFRVRNGVIEEALVTLRHPSPRPNLDDPQCMSEITTDYDYRPCSIPYYGDPVFDSILDGYRKGLADTHVLFPIGPLRCLAHLRALCDDRLLLLSSDKGYTEEEELFFLSEQYLQSHGCISTMVNYHALASYTLSQHGMVECGTQLQQSLKTVALLYGRGDMALRERFSDTVLAFQTFADDFGPYDFYTHASAVRDQSGTLSLDGIFSLLRLSRFDPNVLMDNAQRVIDQVPQASEHVRRELGILLERTYAQYIPLGRDLPFELGRIYLVLGRPREAIRFNDLSLKLFGDHAVTWCNQALCHHQAEDDQEALRCLDRALELDPENATARAWRARLRGVEKRRNPPGKSGQPTASKNVPANSNGRR